MNNSLHLLFCRWVAVVIVAFFMPCELQAQVQAEYYIDTDPGLGNATTIVAPVEADGTLIMDIPTNGLSQGDHIIGIRAYITSDVLAQTITSYGPTIVQCFVVKDESANQQVLYAEYFFDSDPGFGKGILIPVTPGKQFDLDNLEISTAGLDEGEHLFGIRVFGKKGWGPTIIQHFVVKDESANQQVLYAEYFFDSDPGFGKGISIPVTPGKEIDLDNLEISTSGLDEGEHLFGIRVFGKKGWGPTIVSSLMFDAEVDGIKNVNADGQTISGTTYNVVGMKVGPDYKGIVIRNGMKILKR